MEGSRGVAGVGVDRWTGEGEPDTAVAVEVTEREIRVGFI